MVLSSIVTRRDKDGIANKVSSFNSRLKTFCAWNDAKYIDNSNVDASCLGIKRLHLNKKSNSYLANSFIKFLRKID